MGVIIYIYIYLYVHQNISIRERICCFPFWFSLCIVALRIAKSLILYINTLFPFSAFSRLFTSLLLNRNYYCRDYLKIVTNLPNK